MHLEFASGMTFFSGQAGVVGDREFRSSVELLQQSAAILEQCLAQTQFDRFAVAHPMALEVLSAQPEEGLGFLELFVGEFFGLKFFLMSASCDSN
jgi:hypothetical protein